MVFFRSRKAAINVVVVLILTVIVGLAVIALGYKIAVASGSLNKEQKCRLSVFAAHQAASIKTKTAHVVDMVPNLECEAKEIIFKPKDVKRSRNGRLDDELLKEKIAKELFKCWSMVGAGDLDPFQALWPQFDRTYCMTCATIQFDKDFIAEAQKQPYTLSGISYYLATRVLPREGKTFYQYMYKRTPPVKELQYMQQVPEKLSLDKKYFIIWRFERQDAPILSGRLYYDQTIAALKESYSTSVIGFTLGHPIAIKNKGTVSVGQGVYLMPQEQLSEEIKFKGYDKKDTCTLMIN